MCEVLHDPQCVTDCDHYCFRSEELADENERLRKALDDMARGYGGYDSAISILREENEQLRGANEWLRELVATESCPTCAALSKENE
jgi:hypothetical protein